MSIGTFTDAFDRPIDPVDRLLRRRVIMLSGPIDSDKANDVMARLLFLEHEDPGEPIELRINSPGGEVLSGLAIVDTIAQLRCPVATTCAGMAASMASVLLACGMLLAMIQPAAAQLVDRSHQHIVETFPGEVCGVPVTITVVVAMFFLQLFGPVFQLPEAVLSLSIFHLYGTPMTTGVQWGAVMALTVGALALAAGSLVGLQRRDIAK